MSRSSRLIILPLRVFGKLAEKMISFGLAILHLLGKLSPYSKSLGRSQSPQIRFDSLLDILRYVGGTDEEGFKLRGRQINALLKHSSKIDCETLGIR